MQLVVSAKVSQSSDDTIVHTQQSEAVQSLRFYFL